MFVVCSDGIKKPLHRRREPKHRGHRVLQDGRDAQGHATTKDFSRLTHGLVTEPNFCGVLGAKVGDAENVLARP